jgi:hypothetical protein
LLFALCVSVLWSSSLNAQAPIHKHVAPLAPTGVDLLWPVRRVSPLMNYPDQSWNLGESPSGIDLGGAHDRDDPTNALMPTYESYPGLGGWHPHPENTQLLRFVGRLRPPGGNRGTHGELPAAFLVVAPQTIPTQHVVMVIFTQPTMGPYHASDLIYQPHNYPGSTAADQFDLLTVGAERVW